MGGDRGEGKRSQGLRGSGVAADSRNSKPPGSRHQRRIAQHAGPASGERSDRPLGGVGPERPRKTQRGDAKSAEARRGMRTVVAAVIERSDRRLLIGQRRRGDTSPLKWEFPGGKVESGETPEDALARELKEELGVVLTKCAPIGRVVHKYAQTPEELEILFYATAIADAELAPHTFEKVAWVLPKELGEYDFLAANAGLVANLATGRIKPAEVL